MRYNSRHRVSRTGAENARVVNLFMEQKNSMTQIFYVRSYLTIARLWVAYSSYRALFSSWRLCRLFFSSSASGSIGRSSFHGAQNVYNLLDFYAYTHILPLIPFCARCLFIRVFFRCSLQFHSFRSRLFIHQLKVQEAMRKKEKFQREHEEVSQDFLLYLFARALKLFRFPRASPPPAIPVRARSGNARQIKWNAHGQV